MTLDSAILAYLSRRPIIQILDKSHEKNNVRALQLMCIIDHHMEERKMYERFAEHPKMLTQLLQFHSFVSFKYYDYCAHSKVFQKLLQCKFCQLIGPCALILTHMAINHNNHIGLKTCLFCNRIDFSEHLKSKDGLDNCYEEYKKKFEEVEDFSKETRLLSSLSTIVEFYEMLNTISNRLNVCIKRNHGFTGNGHKVTEKIHRNYGDDFHSECIVFNARKNNHKELDSNNLQNEFNRVVKTMGDNEITHFLRPKSIKFKDSIQIIDDNDDEIYLQPAQLGFGNQSQQPEQPCLEYRPQQPAQPNFENQSFFVSLTFFL